jgi:hypothetical protein
VYPIGRRPHAARDSNWGDVMEDRPGIVGRAFEIARSGTVASTSELCEQLTAEGYADTIPSLAGRSISTQLSRMITEARLSGSGLLKAPADAP